MSFEVGDIVRCERKRPTRGTWANYADRVGRVVNADNDGEIGLAWQIEPSARIDSICAWFVPSELVLVRAMDEDRRLDRHRGLPMDQDDLRVPADAPGLHRP